MTEISLAPQDSAGGGSQVLGFREHQLAVRRQRRRLEKDPRRRSLGEGAAKPVAMLSGSCSSSGAAQSSLGRASHYTSQQPSRPGGGERRGRLVMSCGRGRGSGAEKPLRQPPGVVDIWRPWGPRDPRAGGNQGLVAAACLFAHTLSSDARRPPWKRIRPPPGSTGVAVQGFPERREGSGAPRPSSLLRPVRRGEKEGR